MAEWEYEMAENEKELANLNNQINLLNEQLDQFTIVAGMTGTLMNITPLGPGDFIYPNQKLGEISPDSSLIAVANVSPVDIGFVEKGQKVVFQIDAFNYNQWGLAEGTVVEISDDVSMISESEVAFRVVCKLDKEQLRLKNGIEGDIKKGMTFTGRFFIAKRSLFQLLHDKVDDWLNPSVP
jgi:HlyD family secretion protein